MKILPSKLDHQTKNVASDKIWFTTNQSTQTHLPWRKKPVDSFFTNKQTSKQASKQTNKQTDKQASKKAKKHPENLLVFGFHDYLSQESAPIRRTSTVWESSGMVRNGWRCVSFFFNFCWYLISEIICWWDCDTMFFFHGSIPNPKNSRASRDGFRKITPNSQSCCFFCSGHNFPP